MPSPVVIILAAGRGERFRASGASTHKLDAILHDQSVLTHVIQAVKDAGLEWHLVRPEGGTRGMGESIALGVSATVHAAGWLILPGDLPLIQPDSLRRVAEGLCEKPVVVPHYRQQQGHPVAFSHAYLPRLTALTGDMGAKEIVRSARLQHQVLDLALKDGGIVQDIDTLADLAQAERHLHRNGSL